MITQYIVYNTKTNKQWVASAEEAMLYISKINGLAHAYVVSELSTGHLMLPIELLARIYKARKVQRDRNASL